MIKDLSKYKRLFTFGCSYTHYKWPTWANVLASEIDNVEFHNFARTGSGNFFISLRVAEANKRFKFNEHDLVIVMYTSFTREDRWVNGYWIGQGNIYNQGLYPESWVKTFSDPNFYLIRDFSLIELTNTYLKSLPCTSLTLSAWPIDLLESNKLSVESFSEDIIKTCTDIYKTTIKDIPKDLRSFQLSNYNINKDAPDFSVYGHTYELNGDLFKDGHPNPNVYRDYLNYLGFPLTNKSKEYSEESTNKLKKCKTENEIHDIFFDELDDVKIRQGLF